MDIRELSEFELDDVSGGKDEVTTVKMGMFGTLTIAPYSSDDGKVKGCLTMYSPTKA